MISILRPRKPPSTSVESSAQEVLKLSAALAPVDLEMTTESSEGSIVGSVSNDLESPYMVDSKPDYNNLMTLPETCLPQAFRFSDMSDKELKDHYQQNWIKFHGRDKVLKIFCSARYARGSRRVKRNRLNYLLRKLSPRVQIPYSLQVAVTGCSRTILSMASDSADGTGDLIKILCSV